MRNELGIIMSEVYIADVAKVVGDVKLGNEVGIWYNAVVRGDHGKVIIGDKSNIQDNCTIHTQIGHDMEIGEGVSIGHGAICHGEYIGDNTLIGMGAILLNGSRIGANCIIGAGALVKQNADIPDGSLAFGSPARVVRKLTDEEIEKNRENADEYIKLMKEA